jgi:hypothetical protein
MILPQKKSNIPQAILLFCAIELKMQRKKVYKNFSGVDYDDFHLLFYDDFFNDKNGMEKIV